MNPLKSVIVGIVLVLFVVLVFITQFTPKEDVDVVVVSTEPLTCQEDCYGDVDCLKKCDIIETNLALKDEDKGGCDTIENSENKKECKENFEVKQAYDDLDQGECSNIVDEIRRDNCVGNVLLLKALKEENSGLCNQIINEETKQLCRKIVQ